MPYSHQTNSGSEPSVNTQELQISAPNDWKLSGTLFEPTVPAAKEQPVILISGAAAVPHRFYTAFAQNLVEHGAAAVLTYDYRGIAKSGGERKRWPELQMKDWALLDLPAVANFLTNKFPNHPLVGLGHSYGGQALGLCITEKPFERYATIATMSGYWRGVDTPYQVWLQTQIFGKFLSNTLGYIPKWGGIGETMPGKIFLDWARWINSPDYFFSDHGLPEVERFKNVTLPFLSVGIADDDWGTARAISSFMKHYSNADFQQHWISPGESGKIGHLGYFRQRHRDTHWPAVTQFLISGNWPKQQTND